MFQKILGALAPVVITILLGYFAVRHHDFSQNEVPTLSRMVMSCALPLSLFISSACSARTTKSSRS
ncbi:MAG: AEC family transporter [Alphaproteobacteria bacterium]